jgi:hypothetical protein
MPYKKKIAILGITAIVLALIYSLTLVFDPERINTRNAAFTWLPAGARDEADRIEITRGEQKLALVLESGKWFALFVVGGQELEVPVKQGRVDDLFRLLNTRGAFPRRGSSAASHGDLGLGADAARLVIRGGAGLPLLDLLVGNDDSSGREVFLRNYGEDVFRSGDRLISSYVKGERTAWYDLKLFTDASVDLVQRVRIRLNGPEGTEEYSIIRGGENWTFEGDALSLNKEKVETWIQGILESQGEDFLYPDNFIPAGTISVELGNGAVFSLQIGQSGEDGKSPALVAGNAYGHVLPQWAVTRILRERTYFLE